MKISAIIPSYRNAEYLNLCLNSAFLGKECDDTEIIVVLDGFIEESREVLNSYPGVLVIENETNRGESYCHNVGVTMCTGDWILIVNNDNVFPDKWDSRLKVIAQDVKPADSVVWAPNQIEPRPSIFKSFVIDDCGIKPDEFKWGEFKTLEEYASSMAKERFTTDGSTWPVFMNKKKYMALRGIDTDFPHPPVADWDFFYRCQLAGMTTLRSHKIHFYHFAGAANVGKFNERSDKEQECMQYFKWKWGFYPRRNELNNII